MQVPEVRCAARRATATSAVARSASCSSVATRAMATRKSSRSSGDEPSRMRRAISTAFRCSRAAIVVSRGILRGRPGPPRPVGRHDGQEEHRLLEVVDGIVGGADEPHNGLAAVEPMGRLALGHEDLVGPVLPRRGPLRHPLEEPDSRGIGKRAEGLLERPGTFDDRAGVLGVASRSDDGRPARAEPSRPGARRGSAAGTSPQSIPWAATRRANWVLPAWPLGRGAPGAARRSGRDHGGEVHRVVDQALPPERQKGHVAHLVFCRPAEDLDWRHLGPGTLGAACGPGSSRGRRPDATRCG